jgi:hypothetical protein
MPRPPPGIGTLAAANKVLGVTSGARVADTDAANTGVQATVNAVSLLRAAGLG